MHFLRMFKAYLLFIFLINIIKIIKLFLLIFKNKKSQVKHLFTFLIAHLLLKNLNKKFKNDIKILFFIILSESLRKRQCNFTEISHNFLEKCHHKMKVFYLEPFYWEH